MKTIYITGATSGFGEAIARRFASEGWRLVITGRRQERLTQLAEELAPAPVYTSCYDVRDKEAVQKSIQELPEEFKNIDVLVNNAGLALGLSPAHKSDMNDWETMVDTNIKGLLYVTHALLDGMVERNVGHVINLGSIAGTYPYPGGNVYGGTKAFVEQFSKNLRADLLGTAVRVTNVEPGMAESEFSLVRFKGDAEKACSVYDGYQPLTPQDIAEITYWSTMLPPHVNINAMEVMPVAQAFGAFPIHKE
ncbi:MAG: SDR family oxidoreductase [Desulfovibrio sp.]